MRAAPERAVNMGCDLLGILNGFNRRPTASNNPRVDLDPETPDFKINIIDIVRILDAFRGLPYPFAPRAFEPCP